MSFAKNIYSNELQAVFGATYFLKNTNHNRFIGSNSPKERILRGLKIVGMDNYFNENSISSFDLVGKSKPEPDIYLRSIEVADLNKNETIIIEDSVIGIQAGIAAGIDVTLHLIESIFGYKCAVNVTYTNSFRSKQIL